MSIFLNNYILKIYTFTEFSFGESASSRKSARQIRKKKTNVTFLRYEHLNLIEETNKALVKHELNFMLLISYNFYHYLAPS